MPTVNPATLPSPSPQFFDSTGAPASGYQLFVYLAGSVSTKTNSYTDSTGTVANTNPLILNSLGRPATQIWIPAGVKVKFVLASPSDTDPPTSGTTLGDQLSGINDTTVSINEWVSGPAPTFINAISFSLVGDQTATFTVGRRLQFTVTAGTVYGRITASSFAAVTTVTVVCDPSQALDSGLSAVSYGLLSSTAHPSIPWISVAADTVSTVASAGTVNLDNNGKDYQFISGTTTITAITLAQAKECTVEFTGALTLTNGASLVLPGAANITTAAGDVAIFRGEASGVVRCVAFLRAAAPTPEQPTVSVASAATVNLETAGSQYVQITGTTGITAITLNNGAIRFVEFSGALQITNGASLILPGNGNINTVAGATAVFVGESGGVVRCLSYFASGTFTASLTGCTAGVTSSAVWSQNGNVITVNYQPMTGTSNTTACTITGQPNPLKPVTAHNAFGVVIQDNSAAASFGRADVNTDGTITLFVNASSAAFTAANVKGLFAGCTLTYNLN